MIKLLVLIIINMMLRFILFRVHSLIILFILIIIINSNIFQIIIFYIIR